MAELVSDVHSELVVSTVFQPDLHEVLARAQTEIGTDNSWLIELFT